MTGRDGAVARSGRRAAAETAAGRIAWGACVVGVLHIIREARYRRDPHSHDIKPIATAHEGRLVPLEDDRAREWSEIA
jgi:hypothetical protein